MRRAASGVDAIVHAAALKHVPLCEYNPFEAMKTNVLGTQACVEAAIANNVDRFVLVSTDKAVNPVSTMGASKFLAERLVLAAGRYQGSGATRFCAVRFGNVLDSRGSVVETFRRQLESGQPPTVTDARMTRFVMPIPAAARLILHAGGQAQGGEIFILKMPTVRIGDLLRAVAQDVRGKPASLASLRPTTIGLREGEKLHEELMTEDEASRAIETKDMFVVGGRKPGARKAKARSYSSRAGPFLGVDGIRRLLAQTMAAQPAGTIEG